MLKKAIERDPQNGHTYIKLAKFYREQGKFPQAEELLKKAIEVDPQNDDVYIEFGSFFLKQDRLVEAEQAYRKALELNPGNENGYVKLGEFYQKQGKFLQAEAVLQRAIRNNPKHDYLYALLSRLYEKSGRLKLAKEYARKANTVRVEYCNPVTRNTYHKLKRILDEKGIKLVCVQYPVRSVEQLKNIFGTDARGIIFVDNEKIFKEALQKSGYKEYFRDMFAGDFGHCTEKGNRLLAENIACTILKEVFNK